MNRIIAITGPSGAGKTTLGLSLLERGLIVKQSTTRDKRIDDDENAFRYLSHDEFLKLACDDKFLFWSGDSAEIKKENGNFYGILKEDFENALGENKNLIMFVSYKDIDALLEIKKKIKIDIVTLTFKNFETIRERIQNRSIDVDKRIESAKAYEEEFGDRAKTCSDVVIYTDELGIEETRMKVIDTLRLNEKYYYIGFNANNSICNENFFDGSFTLYPNNESGNIYFKNEICDTSKEFYDEYKKFVLSNITPDMKLYAFNSKVRKLFEGDIKFENSNNEEVTNYLNNKFELKKNLQEIIPVIPFEIVKGSEVKFNYKLVAQECTGSGGDTTIFVEKEEDLSLLKPDTDYAVSKYFKSNPLNATMIVSDNEIMFLALSMQLIKITDNKFKYIGADFEFANSLLDEIKEKVKDICFKVATHAKEKGYRGILGIDLMQNENEIYFTEVNPRFQSSSFMISNELKKYNLSVAHLNDIAMRREKLPEIEEVILHSSFINCNENSKLLENPDYEIRNGYFEKNITSIYRRCFNRSISGEIDVQKA
ncbi:MAG: ATP-grasp domain-containing protein [Clostridia bacterium]|nr:ATP-grasp domain-containing protein [Clostridia bacterium]